MMESVKRNGLVSFMHLLSALNQTKKGLLRSPFFLFYLSRREHKSPHEKSIREGIFCVNFYSYLSASIGSSRAALRAG